MVSCLEANIQWWAEALAGCFPRGRRLPLFLLHLRFGDGEIDALGILPPDELEWQVAGLGEKPALDDDECALLDWRNVHHTNVFAIVGKDRGAFHIPVSESRFRE